MRVSFGSEEWLGRWRGEYGKAASAETLTVGCTITTSSLASPGPAAQAIGTLIGIVIGSGRWLVRAGRWINSSLATGSIPISLNDLRRPLERTSKALREAFERVAKIPVRPELVARRAKLAARCAKVEKLKPRWRIQKPGMSRLFVATAHVALACARAFSYEVLSRFCNLPVYARSVRLSRNCDRAQNL